MRTNSSGPSTSRAITSCLLICAALLLSCATAASAASTTASVTVNAQHLFRWRPFLAPFHSVVLHFPIGFLTAAFILEFYRLRHPGGALKKAVSLITWLSLVSGLVSASLGWLRAASGEYDPAMVDSHRWAGIAVVGATLLTLFLQWQAYREQARSVLVGLYRVVLSGTLVLLVVAGHYGGNLTHGSRYLVENAPEFVRHILDDPPRAATAAHGSNAVSSAATLYAEKVKPILEAKCFRCHGPEKQKGGLRLDDVASARKGGESGKAAIIPREPLNSHAVQLMLSSAESDEVMPPAGKEPLTPEQLGIVIDWIRRGADTGANAAPGISGKGV